MKFCVNKTKGYKMISPEDILKKSLKQKDCFRNITANLPSQSGGVESDDGPVKKWIKNFFETYLCCCCYPAFWARSVSIIVLVVCAIIGTETLDEIDSFYSKYRRSNWTNVSDYACQECLQREFIANINMVQLTVIIGVATLGQLYGMFQGKLLFIKIWLKVMVFGMIYVIMLFVSATSAQILVGYKKTEGSQLGQMAIMVLFVLVVYIYYERETKQKNKSRHDASNVELQHHQTKPSPSVNVFTTQLSKSVK